VPRPLYRQCQGTLMLGTGASLTPRRNLTPIRYIVAQFSRLFVVYHHSIRGTKGTNLTLSYIPRPTLPSRPCFARPVPVHSSKLVKTLLVNLASANPRQKMGVPHQPPLHWQPLPHPPLRGEELLPAYRGKALG
jgi:hypothetical protein